MGNIPDPKPKIESSILEIRERFPRLATGLQGIRDAIFGLISVVNGAQRLLALEIDCGYKACAAADVGGTLVYLNYPISRTLFIGLSVRSGVNAYFATHTMPPDANPQSFRILVWDVAGARANENVFWLVIGEKR